MIHLNSCPICNATEIEQWKIINDFSVSGKSFPVYFCKSCTVKFSQDIPDANEIGIYYQSEQYVSHSDSKSGLINTIYHWVRNYTLKVKRDLIEHASNKKSGRVFDLGSGTGSFLDVMKKGDWNVYGIEPDQKARLISTQKGLNVDGPEKLYSLENNSFDVITLWHVLEHVHDLHSYLEIIKKSLKKDGVLVIAVPNNISFDADFYKEYWAALDVPRHLYHFNPNAMQVLLDQHNFQVVDLKPMWFDSFYVSMLSEKYKKGFLFRSLMIGFISNMVALFNRKKCSSIIYIVKPV